jgi:non-specific serine/threonine protein kinase
MPGDHSDTLHSPLTLHLFGAFEARVYDQPSPLLRSRKLQVLLALLVLRHDRDLPRDWLAAALWPDTEESQGRFYLRKSLSELRHALGGEADRLQSPTPRTLRLDLSGADVDVIAFDAALVRGDLASLQKAIVLYRGPLLENCDEEWVLSERTPREEGYLAALETLATRALASGDRAEAIHYLRGLIVADALRESAHRTLMQALAADGNFAAAVQVYRDLRLLLRRELNAEPDLQTAALYEQLRREGRERAKTRRPEWPDVSAPVSRPLSAVPHNLPQQVTSFIGRESEMQQVQHLLAATRLLTLTGVGGAGKTRLALQVAAEALADYPDGVWLVELAALSQPSLLPQSVLQALGEREKPDRSAAETLLDFLRSKNMLLVLDNCEHLVAACARLADSVLRSCPQVKILATSREALQIMGEQPWRVPPMEHPALDQLPSEEKELAPMLLEYDACQLFVERARVQRPDFVLTRPDARALAHLCKHLDGIPLALELAAARMRVLSLEEINGRLGQRFRLLVGGSRTAQPRQQTLRSLIDWSYDLLNAQERTLLCRAAVFAGGWSLEAAEQVCSDPEEEPGEIEAWEILDLLTSLIDKSLVVFEARGGAEPRYRLLETIRLYAQERLATEDATALWSRHRDYYLALAETAASKLQGPEQTAWLERLETEHDNLRAALEWCNQDETGAGAGLQLVGALRRFWQVRGYLSEGRAWLEETLRREGAAERTQERASALNGAGVLAHAQGDKAASRAFYEESLAISQELGDKRGITMLLSNLGLLANEQGDNATARALFEESLAISRALDDKPGLNAVLNNLGVVAYDQGDYPTARAFHEESLSIKRELGDTWGIALSLQNLGNIALQESDYERARALFEEGWAIQRELGNKRGISMSLGNMALVAYYQQDYGRTRTLYTESLAISQELGDRSSCATTLHGLGCVAYCQQDYRAMRAYWQESLAIHQGLGNKQSIASLLEALASAAVVEEQKERATRLHAAAVALRIAIGCPRHLQARQEFEQDMAILHAALTEEQFAILWAEGEAMSLEQAVAYALET